MGTATIKVIPARKPIGTRKSIEAQPKMRVAAYCRVSTDREEQESSYEVQMSHYKELINSNPDWEMAGIYADDGISATNTKKREEFNRMIGDCLSSRIDMVITKSISRFARNTVDCLRYVRKLKDRRIPVLFEKENINTMDARGEVLITIMASLAQQESESLSRNVQMGLQFRFQKGYVMVNHNRFLGYTRKEKNGRLEIVPEEAETVRRIYREYLDGSSLQQIASGLGSDGIPNGSGSVRWWSSNVRQILRNEKYIGDALLQKTFTVDVLEKVRTRNTGEVPQYYVEDSHDAIIPRNVFDRVQREMSVRSALKKDGRGQRHSYKSKYALTGIVYCSHCGDIFRRVVWTYKGEKSARWRCNAKLADGSSCSARTVNEKDLFDVVLKAVNRSIKCRKDFLPRLEESIRQSLSSKRDDRISELTDMIESSQRELVALSTSGSAYYELERKIQLLKDSRQVALNSENETELAFNRMKEMKAFLETNPLEFESYDEALARKFIKRIDVLDDGFLVTLKSGLQTKIN